MKRILLLLIIVCAACRNEADVHGAPVPSKIFVWGGLSVYDSPAIHYMNVWMTIKSDDIYDPGYKMIKRTVEQTAKGLVVTLEGVGDGIADTGWAPLKYADCSVGLENIENGIYSIEIVNGSIKNFGTITVADGRADINFPTPFQLEVLHPTATPY